MEPTWGVVSECVADECKGLSRLAHKSSFWARNAKHDRTSAEREQASAKRERAKAKFVRVLHTRPENQANDFEKV